MLDVACNPQPSAAFPTIEDLKRLQREKGIAEHVVFIGPRGFVLAHTDEERATIDLEDCALHGWLVEGDGPPCEVGYYTAVPHEPDAYSEPYGAAPWDFDPLSLD